MPGGDVGRREGGTLAGRALVAVGLLIVFYALALGVAGGLLYVVYLMVTVAHRFNLKLVVILVVGAGAILWGILPRFDRFEAPGPRLLASQHPRLFKMIEDVARSTGQAMPADVFLVSNMNAWVSQRGGMMGFGSRRIMGLGLPLLQVLGVSQLKAVLAHEFGHYHGGDVKLGPWIHKTRAAIGRTITALHQAGSGILHKPFEWYGNMFLRITQAISRNQEYQADALAASIVGPRALIDGLKAVHGGSLAFDSYINGEFAPVIGAGYLPPLAEGFQRFVSARQLSEEIEKAVDLEIKEGAEDPYDTHPPLSERIKALLKYPEPGTDLDVEPAIQLLTDLPQVELQLLKFILVHPEKLPTLKTVDWKDVGDTAYRSLYQAMAPEFKQKAGGLHAEKVPVGKEAMAAWARAKLGDDAIHLSDEDLAAYTARVFGVLAIVHLVEQGWSLQTLPGETITAVKDGAQVQPLKVLTNIALGETPGEDWQKVCSQAGLVGVALGAVTPG